MNSDFQLLLFLILTAVTLSCTSESPEQSPQFNASDTTHSLQVVSGSVDRYHIESQFIDARNVDIWLPGNYSSDKKYSVVYMHDGQMLFDSTQTWNGQEWKVDETVSTLMKNDQIEDIIVVGIWNNEEERHAEYFPEKAIDNINQPERDSLLQLLATPPKADNYLKFLTDELKPFIDKSYATSTDPEHTFVMGSSMGGLISIYAISEYPGIFGGAACMSTHWIGSFEPNDVIPGAINKYLQNNLPEAGDHKIYFDHGTETLDASYPPYQDLIDQTMRSKGYTKDNWQSRSFAGADHSEDSWAQRLEIPLQFLLSK